MTLKNEYISRIAQPGQFMHIKVHDFTLLRTISITETNHSDQTVKIEFKMVGDGMKTLGSYKTGTVIRAHGQNGNGFPRPQTNDGHILLVGGGVGIPPLHFLGQTLSKETGKQIISILGFQSKPYVFYEEALDRKSVV